MSYQVFLSAFRIFCFGISIVLLGPSRGFAQGKSADYTSINSSSDTRSNYISTLGSQKSFGDSSAPVTIVEYVDFNCPFCARFAYSVFPELKEKLIESGEVYFRIRHFPIASKSSSSFAKANAVECAARSGFFRDYRKSVYKIQPSQGVRALLQLVESQDINSSNQFGSCVKTGGQLKTVRREKENGLNKGVRATPSFVINGKVHEGLLTVAEIEKIIAKRDLTSESQQPASGGQ